MSRFCIEKRVYYHDTDCGRVVYYASYLRFFEEARTELFRARALDPDALAAEKVYFVVARLEVDYLASARYGDLLAVSAAVNRLRCSSLLVDQEVVRGDRLLTRARVALVCVDGRHRPRRLPEAVRRALAPARPPGA